MTFDQETREYGPLKSGRVLKQHERVMLREMAMDVVELDDNREQWLATWAICGHAPLTPDERAEIAAEMVARWMTWAEG